eukprot:4685523-Pyramimonas_sp.AAC.1
MRYATDSDGNVTLDHGEYAKQLRLIQHRELMGAGAEAKASDGCWNVRQPQRRFGLRLSCESLANG